MGEIYYFSSTTILISYKKIINLDDITNENNKDHNLKWPYVPDHSYRMLTIGNYGSRKTNTLLNLIKKQDIDSFIYKIYSYAGDVNEPKYQFLIKKCEEVGIKHLNDSKAFIEYSQRMNDFYNNIDGYNPSRKNFNCV